MKLISRIIPALVFCLTALLSMRPGSFADSGMISVSVPTRLPVEVDASGNVYTPDNLTITNNADAYIAVSSVTVTGINGWTLEDYRTDYSKREVDLKSFGMNMAGSDVPVSGIAGVAAIPFIEGGTACTINYSVSVAVQSRDLSDETIGSVVMTLAWKEGQLYAIDVRRPPDRTSYGCGENFDPTGMEVYAVYYGGAEERIYDYSVNDGSALPYGKSSVTISYTDGAGKTKTASVPITVTRRLTQLRIVRTPDKTVYSHGENFSASGATVRAVYSDGYEKDVTANARWARGTLEYTDTSVGCSYTEDGVTVSTGVSVTVRRVLSGISITSLPNVTEYTENETIDPAGMTVAARYTDGGTKAVTAYTYSPAAASAGSPVVTVSYTENGVTKTASFPVTVRTIRDISGANVVPDAATFTYDGTAKIPNVLVTYDGAALSYPGDYTISASNNVSAGQATLTVTGTGLYTGSKTISYTILPRTADLAWSASGFIYDGSVKKPTASVSNLAPGDSCAVTVSAPESVNEGSYTATATALSNPDYTLGTGTTHSYTIRVPQPPTFAAGSIKSRLYAAGLPSGAAITETVFTDLYSPTGAEVLSCALDSNLQGDITGYVTESSSGYSLVISGNGSGVMYLNSDSSYAFSNLSGSFSGTGLLNGARAVNLSHMFENCRMGAMDFSFLYSARPTNMSYMFAGASVSSISGFWNLTTSSVTDFSHMFSFFSGVSGLNLSMWDFSAATDMSYMFYSASVESVYTSNSTDAVRNFTHIFGSELSAEESVKYAYATGNYSVRSCNSMSVPPSNVQYPFYGNGNFTNNLTRMPVDLKIRERSGVLIYHEAFTGDL